ncbi:fimbrial biogenesis outer membrane usher protein [Salmonella enterica subsp. enterica]|nr:fimbrial biogenesis outer membrane usher protein [Salmonella enterica subsp. enterica]ECJ5197286.1 fimbrial biogenesis outer membrane usher protein [Salmonella enterica subsp. enterica]MJY56597.1 fimbrial biogenesis outer membrane usher protein [Salmonella enterica subsp. enterica serovar Milwaukee]
MILVACCRHVPSPSDIRSFKKTVKKFKRTRTIMTGKKQAPSVRHGWNRTPSGSLTPLTGFVRSMLVTGGMCVFALYQSEGLAQDWFNPALLSIGGIDAPQAGVTDLSRYEAGEQAPGTYRVSLWMNGDQLDVRDVKFIAGPDARLVPVMTRKEYESLGVRTDATPAFAALNDDAEISDLPGVLPAATTVLHFSQQRLDITVPQMMMRKKTRGEVDPALWDQGIPAMLLDYMLTGNRTRDLSGSHSPDTNSLYGNFRGGINAGPWRLRSYAVYNRTQSGHAAPQTDFNIISTYLQRNIAPVRGALTVGDASTPADVFDSVQFRGIQLASDEAMMPDSLRGFAPVIRGVADSNAQVTVRQNGNIIYQTYVPPGPFEITDIYPSSLSGDLEVSVKENNGRERRFTQAYSSVAVMQREGQFKYALTAGRLRLSGQGDLHEAKFVQGTLIYGLPHDVTVYGGGQVAESYLAGTVGLGVGLGALGAMSLDATQANATLPDGQKTQGQSYRVRYSKSMVDTGTTVSLAAYRYSTRGYYSLQDASTQSLSRNDAAYNTWRPRSELDVTLSQSLGDWGSLYTSGTQRDYWGAGRGTQRTWMLGYNVSVGGIGYGLNYSRTRETGKNGDDRRIFMNVSVPLSRWLPGNDPLHQTYTMNANYNYSTDQDHHTSHQVGLSGTALEDSRLSYSLNESFSNQQNQRNSTGVSATYTGRNGVFRAGYNHSQTQSQINYGLSGGVLVHPYGITLSQPMGETMALVRAPGAGNLKVQNQTGLSTNMFGYAVMPSLTPYRRTDITLDPSGIGRDVAISQTSAPVVPTRGAVVLADYRTEQGRQVLMTLLRPDHQPVPFGAMVAVKGTDSRGDDSSTIVGDGGQAFLTGLPDEGTLTVQWGSNTEQHCQVPFRLPPARDEDTGMPLQIQGVCQ